jgi:hypothetical protein
VQECQAAEEFRLSEVKHDFYTKKSVHFNLSKSAHAAFRIACFERSLSMQEVVEEFVQRILAGNPQIIKLLDDVAENKKKKAEKKFSQSDVDSIFNLLEEEDPFKQ